ncbi:MAG: hypothetical protein BIFFINMI_02449 [Phycisphaerae bacterium]|nr:hypothetical protein [Phycisphaerae bacterium]
MILAAGMATYVMTVLVSVSIFFMVFLFIYGLFNQPVEIRYSYQREAAIMAGHTDRQTVYEVSWLGPLMWVMLSLSSGLSLPRLKRRLRRNLIASGNPNYYSVNEFLALAMMSGTSLAAMTLVVSYFPAFGFNQLWAVFLFALGFMLPIIHLAQVARTRTRTISKRVPYSLDLIALSMGAGATFTEAVTTLVREDPTDEFNQELAQVLAEVELGKTRNEALQSLADRIPLESLRMIVGAIIQAESLGTPLTDVLKSQANLLRHQRSVRAEKLAATASVRILIPSMVILLSVVLVVFAPIILRWFKGELF